MFDLGYIFQVLIVLAFGIGVTLIIGIELLIFIKIIRNKDDIDLYAGHQEHSLQEQQGEVECDV